MENLMNQPKAEAVKPNANKTLQIIPLRIEMSLSEQSSEPCQIEAPIHI